MNDSVVEKLDSAANAVEAARLPKDLRTVGFLGAFFGCDLEFRSPAPPTRENEPPPASPSGDQLGRLLELDEEAVGQLFDSTSEPPTLIVPRRGLDASIDKGAQEVILLIAALARASDQDWLPAGVVREACDDRGVLNANFSRTLKELEGRGLSLRGRARSREVRLNAAGVDRASRVASDILSRLA